MKFKSKIHHHFLGSLLVIALSQASQSATFYWDGTNGNWNDLTKWSTDLAGTTDPAVAPLATVSDILNFNTTGGNASSSTLYLNGTKGSSTILATMNFSTSGATTLLGGGSGTPTNNDLFISTLTVNAGSGAVTIGDTAATPTSQVNLKAGSMSFTNNSSSLLTMANGLNSYGSSSTTTFTFTGTGNTLSSGVIGNGTGSNVVALSKSAAGILTLSGANTYTGLTTISAGTLRLGNSNAIGGGGGLTVSGAASIDNSSGSALVMNSVGTVTLQNNLTFGGTNGLTINSAINQSVDSTVTMNGTGGLTFGNYTNTGAGNRILNVVGAASGTLTLNNIAISNSSTSYNLRIGNNGTSNGKVNITGVISDGGTATASSLTIGGNSAPNTVTLGNANTYRGGTTLASGTLNINNAAALGNTAGTFTINGGTLNNTSGGAIVNANNNAQAWNGDFAFTGTNNLDLGTGAVSMGGTRTVTVNGGALTVGGAISGSTFQLRKAGSGTLTLTGAGTYTGNTLVSGGMLNLSHDPADSQPAIKGNVSLSTSSSSNRPVLYLGNNNQLESTATISASLTGANSNFTDLVLAGRSQTIAGYSTTGRPTATARSFIENGYLAGDSGAGVLTINNSSTVTLGGGTTSNQLEIRNNNGTGGGTLALVKDGAGTMVLNLYAASYTGGFTLKNGLVQIAGTAFADTGTVSTSTPLKLEGGTLSSGSTTDRSFGAGNTVSFDGNVTLGDGTNSGKLSFAGAGTLTGNRELTIASTVDYTGAIGQDVAGRSLTKLGTGTLILSNTNTYSGGTTIKAGTLALGNNASAGGAGGIFIGDSSGSSTATLQVSNNQNFANAITVQGSGGVKSINSTTSGASPIFSGGVTLNDDLTLNNNAATSNITFQSNAFALNGKTLTVNSNSPNAGRVTFASTAPITGTSASAINFGGNTSAAGKFRLSAANTFSGTATISGASLGVGGTLALELNHANALQNATLDTGASGNQAVTFILTDTTYNIGALTGSDELDITGSNTISVGTKAVDTVFSGIIGNSSGSGSLTKVGGNNLTLSGTNSYTGLTTVSGGALNVTSTGSLASGNALTVGASGTVDFANAGQTLGAVDHANTATNALNFSASTGTVTLASLTGAGNTRFGSNGTVTGGISTGTVNVVGLLTSEISGGTVAAGSLNATTLSGGATTVGGVATIGTMSSGTANLSGATSAITTLNGGTVNLGSSTVLTVNAGTTSGSIAGSGGSLTKSGAGTLTLSGTNSYTGATTVAGGKLAVNGTTASESAVGVSSGGTLAGSGTVGGNITIASGGALAPGNSPGVLTVSGTSTLESGSIFEWELDTAQSSPETNRGVAYDGVNTTSLAGSGAIFKILLTGTQDFTDNFWNQTRSWTDIFKSADGSTTLTDWASVFSGGFQYSYNGKTVEPTSSGFFTLTGNSLTWSAVPEPSNALAGLLAASGLLRRRRVA